jgi:hypothetical protein
MNLRSIAVSLYRKAYIALPPKASISLQFLREQKRLVSFRDPVDFSDKIQVRKLTTDDPRFTRLSDKVLAKDHAAGALGDEWIIPTLWSGTELPNDPPWPLPFVVKANHASGWNIFVRDLSHWEQVRDTAHSWLSMPWKEHLHERHYNKIDRQILVEPLIGDGGDLPDYKFFVFHGRAHLVQVDTGRFTDHRRAFYDRDWQLQPFGLKYPRETRLLPRPAHFDQMTWAAERLAADFDFVRVDFYDLPEGPKFGEMTFTPGSGFEPFEPREYDRVLGDLWSTEGA